MRLEPASRRLRLLGAAAAVAVAVALAFGGAVGAGFVPIDDGAYVYGNPRVQAGLTPASAAWAFGTEPGRPGQFLPLSWLSLMLDRTLLGPEPWGFHLVNVLLHAATAIALLLLLERATGRLLPSLAAALLFAVHPLAVDGVVWVAERKNVLAGLFAVSAAAAWVAYAARPGWRRYAAVAALYAGSLLSKSAWVTLPALLLVLDVWPLARLRRAADPGAGFPRVGLGTALLEKAPLAAMAGAVVAIAIPAAREMGPCTVPAPQLSGCVAPLPLRVANAIAAVARYAAAAFWPTGFAPHHPFPAHVPAAAFGAGLLVLLAGTALAVAARHHAPAVPAGWAWFLVALSPVLGIVQVGGQWGAWAERFMYGPLVGLAIAVAFGGAALAERWRLGRAVPAVAAAAAVAALAAATRVQAAYWKDGETLLRRTIAVEPLAAIAHVALGNLLLGRGDLDGAEASFRRAVDAQPWYGEAHHRLGEAAERRGDLPAAELHFREATRNEPDILANPYRLAEVLRAMGRTREARPWYARVAELLRREGREDEARAILARAAAPGP